MDGVVSVRGGRVAYYDCKPTAAAVVAVVSCEISKTLPNGSFFSGSSRSRRALTPPQVPTIVLPANALSESKVSITKRKFLISSETSFGEFVMKLRKNAVLKSSGTHPRLALPPLFVLLPSSHFAFSFFPPRHGRPASYGWTHSRMRRGRPSFGFY